MAPPLAVRPGSRTVRAPGPGRIRPMCRLVRVFGRLPAGAEGVLTPVENIG